MPVLNIPMLQVEGNHKHLWMPCSHSPTIASLLTHDNTVCGPPPPLRPCRTVYISRPNLSTCFPFFAACTTYDLRFTTTAFLQGRFLRSLSSSSHCRAWCRLTILHCYESLPLTLPLFTWNIVRLLSLLSISITRYGFLCIVSPSLYCSVARSSSPIIVFQLFNCRQYNPYCAEHSYCPPTGIQRI